MERSKPYRGARWGRLGRLALGVLLALAMALGVGIVAPTKNAVAADAGGTSGSAKTINVNTQYTDTIASTTSYSDVDWFRYSLPAKGKVRVDLSFAQTDGVPYRVDFYSLKDSANYSDYANHYEYEFGNGTKGSTGTFRLPAGTYYVEVSAYDVSALKANSDYAISVNYINESTSKLVVSFDANGGVLAKGSDPKSVSYGAKYALPANPSRSGYTFSGWFTAKSGGDRVTSSTKVDITGTQTLYAQWKAVAKPTPIYTVSFDANGGKFTDGSASQKVSVKQGAKYALAAAPSRSGYLFTGWYTAKTGGSKVTGSPTATGSRTLYAQWKAVPSVKVATSFSAVSSSNVTANSASVLATLKDSANKPVVGAGVVFATADGKASVSVKTDASGVARANLTGLKASTKYSVSAKYAGDATHSASMLKTPIAFTTKAVPKPTPIYTISFDANGGKFADGSSTQQVSAKQGAKYALAAAPSRSGYTFSGWFTARTGGSKVTGTPVATGSLTLYAQWTKNVPAKVATAFSSAGSSNVTANSASVLATLKDSAGKPVAGAGVVFATADGKTSVNVKTDASGVAKANLTGLKASMKYSVGAKFAGDATHSASTLKTPIAFTTKAAPKPVPVYTVSFDANGGKFANGSAVQKVSVKQGAKYALAAAPSRSGYSFAGWFTAKLGGSKVTGTPTATGSLTLYAQWAKNAPAPKPAPKPAVPQPVYRLYNPNSGLHHYTTSAQERDALVKLGWKSEGASFNAAKQGSAAGLVPVYREYNPHNGNHNWTANKKEHDQLVSLGWKDEGIAWYVPAAGPVKVLRLYNPNSGEHVYTTSAKEYAAVGKAGWHQEGLAWTAL
jgi:uncharacterized repeat protein (TIGR02543 family)